jgi:hypothetical protein
MLINRRKKTTIIERDFLIHGHLVRICFAGQSMLEPCTLALEHLAVEPGNTAPELTIYAWDSASSGINLPPCPWQPQQIAPDGTVRDLLNDSLRAALQVEIGALSHYYPKQHLATMIHGGVVGTELGGALLVGHSGSGKSTSTLACLNAGMRFVTDDRCLLSLSPEPSALCIYNSAKLWPEQMRLFPQLMPKTDAIQPGRNEKDLLFIQQILPKQLAFQLPIRVILLTHIVKQPKTTLSRVSPIRVLRDLIPSTLIYQPGAAHDEMRVMSELLRRVPCLQINLGSELTPIPVMIAKAIAGPKHPFTSNFQGEISDALSSQYTPSQQ